MTNSQKASNLTPIEKNTRLVLIGSIIFACMGVLNIAYQFTPIFPIMFPKLMASHDIGAIMFVYQTISYVLYSITFISLIPLAIGIRNITDIYFVDHITKAGKQTAFWILLYAIVVPLDMITLGWPVISGMIALAIIVGRVMAFRQINITFEKIKRIFDVKVGSFIYILFAFYSLIVMTLGAIAEYSEDIVFQINLSIFNGAIESGLMIIVGIKLIIDVYRIKEFIEVSGIKPYSAKKAFLVADRTEKPVLATTKEHVQSKTQIEKLQKKAAKQEMRIQQLREKDLERKAKQIQREEEKKKKLEDQFIFCHQCNQRTDKNLTHCMNCGESLKDETERIKKEISEIAVRRILSPKKEKILQQIVFGLFVIAFVTYAFVIGDFTLIIYAWIIIAVFATYLFVNYVVLFFSGRGFAVTTMLSDIAFLFVILPVLSAIFSYFVAIVVREMAEQSEINRPLLIILSIAISLLTIVFTLRFRVSRTNMSLREYIRYRMDFKARAAELNKEQERVEKKRSNFDSLDRIEAHMAKQREEKVMDYKDFDLKQRLKDLGSPLTNDDEDQ